MNKKATKKELQDALLLAGQLAGQAELVIKSNMQTISSKIYRMEKALNDYNKEIIRLSNK